LALLLLINNKNMNEWDKNYITLANPFLNVYTMAVPARLMNMTFTKTTECVA